MLWGEQRVALLNQIKLQNGINNKEAKLLQTQLPMS